MIVTVAVGAACALTLLSLRSSAFAFGLSFGGRRIAAPTGARARQEPHIDTLTQRQIAVMLVEIAMSLSIVLLSVGLAAAAALPAFLLFGALLAQFAVLGALFAPPALTNFGGITIRPAALALGIAQLAQVVFLLRAIEALV